MNRRADALAWRVEQGHQELVNLIEQLSDEDWKKEIPGDGRTVGVVIHHVASVLPIETSLFKKIAAGDAIEGVTIQGVAEMNAQHARDHAQCTKEETLALLKQNSALVGEAIRSLSDVELDQAAPVSLHWHAPLTAQYFIEDHPLSHSRHHLSMIQALVDRDI